ncbi:hypothetical protein [Pseudarthrobacter oxydans]|uniref:hypothetical protein n=1 Tax=Pseudarthrobacter oxydans TaxID=1671 RepID=UPI0035EB9F3A|nr:hypothetical protein GCM10017547_38460 [Pseudarthrobacter oxydans]
MPMFEYVVGVTPPGGHKKHYHRGEVYCYLNDEEAAAKKAIDAVSARYGFNLNQEYSCVVLCIEPEET